MAAKMGDITGWRSRGLTKEPALKSHAYKITRRIITLASVTFPGAKTDTRISIADRICAEKDQGYLICLGHRNYAQDEKAISNSWYENVKQMWIVKRHPN